MMPACSLLVAVPGVRRDSSFLANAIRVVREYERLVVFRLGRLIGERAPAWCC